MNALSLRTAIVLACLAPLAANAATPAPSKSQAPAVSAPIRTAMAEVQAAPGAVAAQASGERKIRVVLPSPYRVE